MEIKRIYCVGNAHLDPVWLWRWQEGSCEAKATIRSALDRMNEYPDFRFVCSSSSVYRWIEEFAPEMFEEVRRRVAEGRFVIVGGWVVQPDCNNPAGESFARQSLYGQRYFMEKFGRTAKVGYNVDSFGHNAMLPQILKKSGMDAYVYMRPSQTEMPMERSLFRWEAPDGSSVLACRLGVRYNHHFTDAADVEEKLEAVLAVTRSDVPAMPFFYGVGNHGGGPTIRSIEALRAYAEAHPERRLISSDVSDFFADCASSGVDLPVFRGDLQHHASGCYAAVSMVKNLIRRGENELAAAEIFSVMANRLLGRAYPTERLAEAWQNLCFCQFHDSMGGCSVREVYDDIALIGGEARSVAARTANNALQSLSWAVGTDGMPGTPVVIFNPHPHEITEIVQLSIPADRVTDARGVPVPVQAVQSSAVLTRDRTNALFCAVLPPMGYTTYRILPAEDGAPEPPATDLAVEGYTLENECLRVEFDPHTGDIKRLFDKKDGRELLSAPGGVPVVIDEYGHDTWSHAMNYFDRVIGRFADAVTTVIETGPVRGTVKVESRYGDSKLTVYYSLCAGERMLRARAEVDWREKRKMLKLAFPTALTDPAALYEIPFGMIERPVNGEEEPGLAWIAVRGKEGALAMLNDNKYSFSVKDNVMNLTVVRSPRYADHGRGIETPEDRYTDIGAHEFSFALCPMDAHAPGATVRAAHAFNSHAAVVIENRHKGRLPEVWSGLSVSAANLTLSALKRSEDGTGLVLRAYETDGRAVDARFEGGIAAQPLAAHFDPYEVKTFLLPDGGTWREVLLTEYDLPSEA